MTLIDYKKNMKAIRHIIATVVMLGAVMPALAQTDEEATIKAVRKVIGLHPPYAVEAFLEKEIVPKFKKSPKVMVGIAKQFEDASDSLRAFKYAGRALELDSKYVPAYVMKGDIYKDWAHTHEDTLVAFSWYDKAIETNPKDPDGYLAYANVLAKTDPEAAINKLSEISNHNPDYDVNLYAGQLYFDMGGNFGAEMSCKYFMKADTSRMSAGDFAAYITVLRIGHYYEKADSVLQTVNNKYPRRAIFNRLMLKNDMDLKKYDHALASADNLFNNSDSLEVEPEDYINYGEAYFNLKRYKDAIAAFQKCIDHEIERERYNSDATFENAKKQEVKYKSQAMQEIAKSYNEMGFSDEAIEMQNKYIAYRKEHDLLDAVDVNNLAEFYKTQFEIEMGEAKLTALQNWYDTYELMAEVSPENSDFAYYTRFQIAYTHFDKEGDGGHGVSDAEKLVEIIPLTDDISSRNKSRLELALSYLASYYFEEDQYVESGKYFKMLGEVNPENSKWKIVSENKILRRKLRL